MTAVENSLPTSNTPFSLSKLANSNRLIIVSFVVLGTLAALMFSLSAWANVKVASVYGTGAIMQHSVYITFLPLSITALAVRIVASILDCGDDSPPFNGQETLYTSQDASYPLQGGKASPQSREVANAHSFTTCTPLPGKCFIKHQVGDTIQKGEIICEVECMKMINRICAEESGKIVEIYIEDGAVLAPNQTIMRIEKSI